MLADSDAANRTQAEYKKLLASLPEDERAIATGFFEKQYQKSPVCMPRVCKIEARETPGGRAEGKQVRIAASDWPVRDLIEALGESAGQRIEVAQGICGVTDFSTDWALFGPTIRRFAASKGLAVLREGEALTVKPIDPMYTASLGERSDVRVKQAPASGEAKNGIVRGYLFVSGHYIPPPYSVDVRTVPGTPGSIVVFVNDVPVGRRFPTALVEEDQIVLTEAKTIGQVCMYAGQRYALLKSKSGGAESKQRVIDEIRNHPLVKSLDVSGTDLLLTGADGSKCGVSLDTFEARKTPAEALAANETRLQLSKAMAEKKRKEIDDTLNADGLVIIPTKGEPRCSTGKKAIRQIQAICETLAEFVRLRDQLSETLFPDDARDRESGWTWEVIFNMRFRDLIMRMERHETKVQLAAD
jgi:hypothetical protein